MNLIDNLNWRYATKRFDTEQKVSEENLALLKEAVRLSASSYGLQLYKVLLIENPEKRAALRLASWNQPQLEEASHVWVFCNSLVSKPEDVDAYLAAKAKVQSLDPKVLEGYGGFMKGKLAEKSPEDQQHWMAKQAYIALANLMMACAELKIDCSPIEGFEPELYDEILGLTAMGLQASVVAAIGYRSAEDNTQHAPKVRKDLSELFTTI